MKLLYTDMWQDMTPFLVKEAAAFAQAGKRVFYIAPNSLSFEKEKKVLQELLQGASFAITVTRFSQMARYLTLNSVNPRESLDDLGLTMLVYQLLLKLPDQDLKVYHRVKQDPSFTQQLVDLYKELGTANMTIADLVHLQEADRASDLMTILSALDQVMAERQFDNQTRLAFLRQEIVAGRVDLSQTVLIIDGYTRFSADEEALLSVLASHCHEVVIGTYASQKAYQATYIQGHSYQASVDFLRHLAETYATKPIYLPSGNPTSSFAQVTQALEVVTSFGQESVSRLSTEQTELSIWSFANQQAEIEGVAKSIRQHLAGEQGLSYKDITVLVGDLDSYQLAISTIFDRFDIPHYLANRQAMLDHPLVNLVESLERIRRYNYRAEDVLNLFKSGLYGQVAQADLDRFEAYVTYADIKGRRFLEPFTHKKDDRYDLEQLNSLRERLLTPLETFLKSRRQKTSNLLQKFQQFLLTIDLPANMKKVAGQASQEEMERHEQVWKSFTHLLEESQTIFGEDKLSVLEFLGILGSGMTASTYRTVPAKVDVVNVQSFDLAAPHQNRLVFALGLTQSHFPLLRQNKSLLTDEDRLQVNEATGDQQNFDLVSQENNKRNHFLALSLFNSASQRLVLTYPRHTGVEEDMSPYLKQLISFGLPVQLGGEPTAVSNYKDILSRLLAVNHLDMAEQVSDQQDVWQAAVPFLRQQLAQHQLVLSVTDEPVTQPVSQEVLALKFPDQSLTLSVSGLTTFYNNQYAYYLRYILGLQEEETIIPDARQHGSYLHKVFEHFMAGQSVQDFDKRLQRALAATHKDHYLQVFYQQSQEGMFSQALLDTIATSVASVLFANQAVTSQEQELPFTYQLQDKLKVRGFIDRIDGLADGSVGIVDYKSSDQKFELLNFYNGLGSQLVTYLQALQEQNKPFFGAMYLHMKEPQLNLAKTKNLETLPELAHKELVYKGLFAEEKKAYLANGYYQLDTYSQAELEALLAYNQRLFEQAYQQIMSGHFFINPYTKDGRSVAGQQFKSITRFSADRHMSYARQLLNVKETGKQRKELLLGLMEDRNDN